MFGYDYYIRINEKKEIIDAFTTGFRQPEKDDIKIAQKQPERCWSLQLRDDKTMLYRLKYIDGKQVEKTREELDSDPAYVARQKQQALAATDANMPRITEDILDVLITKNIIKKDDLPAATQAKIDERKVLRSQI